MPKDDMTLTPIAYIHNDFPSKFGLPRQSGLVTSLMSAVVFEKEFRTPAALKGIEDFTHLWLIWGFNNAAKPSAGENGSGDFQNYSWSPTVRPPRLGGNKRLGVFATRSPFRPNRLGLTVVKLEEIRHTQSLGTILIVSGGDMMDNTPIYDIKPYIPYADIVENASGGFTDSIDYPCLNVIIPEGMENCLPENSRQTLKDVLSQDPRPSYKKDSEQIYGFEYAGCNIRFKVNENTLTVVDIKKCEEI